VSGYVYVCLISNSGPAPISIFLQVGDPYLDTKRACLCVETLLEHFGNRQLLISESWQTWQTNVTVEKEFKVRWEMNVTESTRVSLYLALGCAFMSVHCSYVVSGDQIGVCSCRG
jgi:hypothetical protein